MINLCLIAVCCLVLVSIKPLPTLSELKGKGIAFHLFCAATLTLILLASLTGGLSPQMPMHFIGLAAVSLVIGIRLSLCAVAMVIASLVLIGELAISDIGGYWLAGYIIPLFVFAKWVQLTKHRNLWRFSFVTAGLGSTIIFCVKTLGLSLYYVFVSNVAVDAVLNQYIILSPLFWLPELLFNATVLITLLQHRPQWVLLYR